MAKYPSILTGIVIGSLLTVGVGAAINGSAVFSDVPSGSYYDEAVGEMYGLGIIKGFEDGKFHPNEPATRGQIAVMMQRLRNELKGISNDDGGDDGESVSSSSSSRSSRSSSSSSSSSSFSSASSTPYGSFRFTTAAVNMPENGKLTLSVLRTGGDRGEVTVNYRTADSTAKAGEDYVETTGSVTMKDGETSKLISVILKDDVASEGGETFTITLSDPKGGSNLGTPSTLTVNLIDNEASTSSSSSSSGGGNSGTNPAGEFGFSASAYAISEDAGLVTITVLRSGGTTGIVTVAYATSNGTAKSGSDYTATNGILSFGVGETSKTFTVSVADETYDYDGNKTVNLVLSNPTNTAVLGSPTPVVLTIIDNEAVPAGTGSLKMSTSNYSVNEDANRVSVTVMRVGGTKGTVTVQYRTVDGTARAGSDFTSVTGTLTFLPGESAKTVKIDIKNDTDSEGEENFTFTLESPTGGAQFLTPSSATVKIQG